MIMIKMNKWEMRINFLSFWLGSVEGNFKSNISFISNFIASWKYISIHEWKVYCVSLEVLKACLRLASDLRKTFLPETNWAKLIFELPSSDIRILFKIMLTKMLAVTLKAIKRKIRKNFYKEKKYSSKKLPLMWSRYI